MEQTISSGVTSANIILENDYLTVLYGGLVSKITVEEGGALIISSGGTVVSALVSGLYGDVAVCFGGILSGAQVEPDTWVTIGSGGTATEILENGGYVAVMDGADVTFVQHEIPLLEVLDGQYATIHSGTTVNSTRVTGTKYGGGMLEVCDGAALNNITVMSNGQLDANGFISNVTVMEGGYVNARTNTMASVSIASGGAGVVYHTGSGSDVTVYNCGRYLVNGGSASLTMVSSGGSFTVQNFADSSAAYQGFADLTTVRSGGVMKLASCGSADHTTVDSGGLLYLLSGGSATNVTATSGARVRFDVVPDTYIQGTYDNSAFEMKDGVLSFFTVESDTLNVSSNGTIRNTTVRSNGSVYVSEGGTAEETTVDSDGWMYVESGGRATGTRIYGGGFFGFFVASNTYVEGTSKGKAFEMKNAFLSGYILETGTISIDSGGIAVDTTINQNGTLTVLNSGLASDTTVNSGGSLVVSSGGKADGVTVGGAGHLAVSNGGKLTGGMTFDPNAVVFMESNAILNFDLTGAKPGGAALVNDLSIIQGTPLYTLTVDGTQENGVYALAGGAAGFNGTISVVNTSDQPLDTLTVGTKASIGGKDYLLTNENSVLSVTVSDGGDTPEPEKAKWTYMVYMAADSDLCQGALYDIVSMQQASLDSGIEICVLVDRTPVDSKDSGDYVTAHGTYRWGSLWPETRVGRITYSPGLTVTVDWESWGELDTGSIDTLKRFVDWAQEASPAENYGLILWDHGSEDTGLCWDLTTDPDWEANFTISEVSGLLKEKGNIPLVIFNNCLLCSELTVTQLAGSTEVIVASEPMSYTESTFNYNVFFSTITAEMTAREMAQIMVMNMEPSGTGITTMLSSVDVTVSRLAAPLEALAGAVAASGNPADRTVLINAMLNAPQDGCLYDGTEVLQSDLGFLIFSVMDDRDYESTSEGFKKALLDVMAALDECVLEYRSFPAGRGSGIAFCNTVCTVEKIAPDSSPERANAAIKSHITSHYKSNPLWGGLLYDLGASYLAENVDALFPPPTFTVRDVEGLVKGGTVSVSDFGCFSGPGGNIAGINLIDDFFFSFIVTAADKSTGKFSAVTEADVKVAVSLLASDGTAIATGTDSVSFENLAPGEYFVRLQSDRNCRVTVVPYAEFMTGVDRFDYAGSGKNEKYANGNGTIDTATLLAEGSYEGLLTCEGDTDYYLIGDVHTERYQIVLRGEDGLTVAELDGDGTPVRSADYKDGKYTLTMDSGNYLFVEGDADLEKELNAYSFRVIGLENGSGDVVLDDLCGTKDEVSWRSSTIVNDYLLEFSMDDFGHALQLNTAGTAVDLMNLPAGTYQWRVGANQEGSLWYNGSDIVSDNTDDTPKVFQSRTDAGDDVFFATPNGTWNSLAYAMHVGTVGGWSGTGELVSASGKGRIQDLFFGSADPSTLYLTDSENGDALFLDDVYTGLPEEIGENTARLCRIRTIKAGAGDDIIDMTSQRFEYMGGEIALSGGDGDDVIWAGNGKNTLYGDDGNDRIVGASGDDVIAGGIGNDTMHGGGGNDIFAFCNNWGTDTIEQLEGGTVTLWFATASDTGSWDESTQTYTDGANSVKVSGVGAAGITLKFGDDQSALYKEIANAFADCISQRIFELPDEPESNGGFLADV